jgi:hypothetical protein
MGQKRKRSATTQTGAALVRPPPSAGVVPELPDDLWNRIATFNLNHEGAHSIPDITILSKMRLIKRSLFTFLSPVMYKKMFKRMVKQREAIRLAQTEADKDNPELSENVRLRLENLRLREDNHDQILYAFYLNMCNLMHFKTTKTIHAAGVVAVLMLNKINQMATDPLEWGNEAFDRPPWKSMTSGDIPLTLP